MELTRDELIEGLRHCAHYGGCKDCPISGYCNGIEQMAIWCLPYVEGKENEPAPVSAGTSSEVSSDDTINSSHFNDTPVLEICQEKLENIQKSILDMYGGFSSKEQNSQADY
jgi:hypothetical protein